VDLVKSAASTLPHELRSNVRTLCVSPDGALLVAIDDTGRSLVINRRQNALLHHFSFKDVVRVAAFSPDGRYLAVGAGRLVQVWCRPGLRKSTNPLELHRTYGHCHSDIVSLDWSEDSTWVAAGSRDLTVRVWSLHTIEGYTPPTLAGHKEPPIGVYFTTKNIRESAGLIGKSVPHLYTLSRDGALFSWSYVGGGRGERGGSGDAMDGSRAADGTQTLSYQGGNWRLVDKYYFNQRGCKLTSCAMHKEVGILAVGFSRGMFELLQLPDLTTVHTLSIGADPVTSMAFNGSGEWIVVGSANMGQMLVWEWRSETYVLKQQGHAYDITSLDFSGDGSMIVTGSTDAKVKLWTVANGFCFVTFPEHSAPITAVKFLPSGHAVLSASLDGTVRAFDLVRYRNFRTLTAPKSVQFSSLAVDPSGDVIVAGSKDTFEIYVWSLKTGKLLDVLAAHEGPVCMVAFSAGSSLLASASWDATVRTWDVFGGNGHTDVLQHNHDVLALAWHPDGKHLASSTLDGTIYYWNAIDAEIEFVIHGRMDIAGGRSKYDRRSYQNTSSGRAFTSLAFSADGSFLLAGGSSKYVCVYDLKEQVMLRRFQISHNRALDGVLDQLNSKYMTDAGAMADIRDVNSDDDEEDETAKLMPGDIAYRTQGAAVTRCVSLSPTGRMWAAATPGGVLMYGLDESLTFDPTNLTEDITPAAVLRSINSGAFLRATLIAVRLGDPALLQQVILCTTPAMVPSVIATLPTSVIVPVLQALANALADGTPHVEHVVSWLNQICSRHARALQQLSSKTEPVLRGLQRSLNQLEGDVGELCDSNVFTLRYLRTASS
jgi:periodic tryptophan protein 2